MKEFVKKPIVSIRTNPYRQIIGLKSYFNSVEFSSLVKMHHPFDYRHIKYVDGLNPKLVVPVRICVTNHYLTIEDAIPTKESFAKKIEFTLIKDLDRSKRSFDIPKKFNLSTGDKISNLHGNKGTSVIVDDDRFSVIPMELESVNNSIETSITNFDIMMNYNSIIRRGAEGMFVEHCKRELSIWDSDIEFYETGLLIDHHTNTTHEAIFIKSDIIIQDKLAKLMSISECPIDWMTASLVGDDIWEI